MSDHANLQRALDVIAAADLGEYDRELGIDPDDRTTLTRAQNGEDLTTADLDRLHALDRPDLIADAYDQGRIINENGARP